MIGYSHREALVVAKRRPGQISQLPLNAHAQLVTGRKSIGWSEDESCAQFFDPTRCCARNRDPLSSNLNRLEQRIVQLRRFRDSAKLHLDRAVAMQMRLWLLAAAGAGELETLEGVTAHTQRLMAMPDSASSIREYHTQLFRTFRYGDIDKDTTLFPSFDTSLNQEFLAADLRFFDYLYEANLGLRGLLLSDVAFVNAATGPLYGVTVFGSDLIETTLADRPGYFTRLGFLALNGTLRQPDPIHRGVEIFSEVMCGELPAPPVDIPPLPPEMDGTTNRQRVDNHTGFGTCGAGCHGTIINPIGFAFENYDSLGVARELDNGVPVDTTGLYSFQGVEFEFNNAVEMLTAMSETPQAHACYAKHVAEFVLARDLSEADAAEIYALGEASLNQASLQDLILAIVQSPSFMTRQGGPLQ